MKKANIEIREFMKIHRVPAWKIAAELGVHENTVIRRMRTELPKETKSQYLQIIQNLAEREQA